MSCSPSSTASVSATLCLDQLELRAHVDRALEAARDGTEAGVEAMHALGIRSAILRHREPVANGDAADHQHLVVELDLTDRLHLVALRIDFDLTRLQRAGEGAGQSAAGRGDHVVERRGVRRVLLRVHAIVLRDLRVHSEVHRLGLGGQMGEPLGAAEPLDPHA
jgi:hypothetical protein